eukprot:scaffold187962_cov55-Attheya_sp.AAC.1
MAQQFERPLPGGTAHDDSNSEDSELSKSSGEKDSDSGDGDKIFSSGATGTSTPPREIMYVHTDTVNLSPLRH